MNFKKTLIILFVGVFSQCASTKFESTPPFKVTEATYNYWTGGQQGVSGIRIKINYEAYEDISFDKIYFEAKEGTIDKYDDKGKTYIVGNINTSKPRGDDLVLDVDSKKEINNKLPETKIPFELEKDEAIIAFTHKGETRYFKLKNIKQTESKFYP